MGKKSSFSLGEAKKPEELAGVYNKAKSEAQKYELAVTTALKEDVVKKMMTDKKKPARFTIEIELGTNFIKLDFQCDVKDGGKWVFGRKMIASVEEYKKLKALAKLAHQNEVAKECHWDI